MTSRVLFPLFVTLAIAPASLLAATASTNCRASHGDIERAVCGSPEYRAMDREIAALADRGMAQFTPADRRRLVESQARCLKQRKGCSWAAHHSAHPGAAVDECLRASMEGRVRALRSLVDHGAY